MSLLSTEHSLMWGTSGRLHQAPRLGWEARATGRGRLGMVASAARVRSSRLEEGATAHPAEADQRPQALTTKATSLGWT